MQEDFSSWNQDVASLYSEHGEICFSYINGFLLVSISLFFLEMLVVLLMIASDSRLTMAESWFD